MAVLILLIVFLLFFVIFVSCFNQRLTALTNLRLSLILTLISFSGITLLITESLSYFNLLLKPPMFFLYLFVGVCLSALIIILIKKHRFHLPSPKKILRSLATGDKIIIGVIIALYLLPLLFIAIYYPPNNADSMTYHLSRIEHWIQNKNIEHYPTSDLRQLYTQPLSEYLVLQPRLLSGYDQFNNLVQFFFMLGSVLLASLIARIFGLSKNGQLLAAVITLTIPMGILQSTSTQTDYVTAFFFLSFLYFGLNIALKKQGNLVFLSVFTGLSFGLGLLAKGTVSIFALPFIVWFLIEFFKNYQYKKIKFLFIIIFLTLLINSAFFIRNYNLTGSISGDWAIHRLMLNREINFKNTLSNIIKNTGLQLGLPWQQYNNLVDSAVYKLHNFIGEEINNPSSTFLSIKYKTPAPGHEDTSGNLIVIMGIIAAIILFLKNYHKFNKQKIKLIYFTLCLFFALVVFSSVLMWQPFSSRLLLPLLAAASLLISYPFEYMARKPTYRFIIISILLLASLPFVIANKTRSVVSLFDSNPVKSRTENYFNTYTNNPEPAIQEYFEILNIVEKNNISVIGLAFRPGNWEYLFWNFYQVNKKPDLKIVHYKFPEYQKNTKNYKPDIDHRAILIDPRHLDYVLSRVKPDKIIKYQNLGLTLILL